MAFQTGPSGPNRSAVDLDDEDSYSQVLLSPEDSESECSSDSDGESTRLSGLAASFRVVSESLVRMEQMELEMAKEREALRLKAEKRRVESEAELTKILLQTQLQIASLVSQRQSATPSRKRKRAEEDDASSSSSSSSAVYQRREGALVLSLLQCNLLF